MYLDDRRPITPALAFRVAILGGIAFLMFSIIFFRLWYLQVLSGDRYVAEANDNRVRDIKVQAPRGQIVDREGRSLVDNRTALAVKVTPAELPKAARAQDDLYRRLGLVLRRSPRRIREDIDEQLAAVPFSTATVKQDVDLPIVQYLLENGDDFPGVTVERVFLRRYPHDEVGAHLFGTVGEVTKEQLDAQDYSGAEMGDRVGQSGVEATYDRYLRGRNGATRVQVDAMGTLTGSLSAKQPRAGRQLRLGVDLDVQRTGQQALGKGRRGAFVVMDVKDGEVRGLGSAPSFDPNLFAKSIKQSDYDRLSDPLNGNPLANRAVQSLYPTGSTFKLITATAGLEGGLIDPETPISDPGSLNVGGTVFKNAGGAVNGVIALRQALSVSSDVFFYKLGLEANGAGDGLGIQRWARRLGLGSNTGIDLPNELPGLVPSPKWRAKINRQGIGDGRPWSAGDNINLSVGQGDLQANPLQMAVAYAAVANGGRVVTPHLGKRIEDADGRVLQELPSPARRRVDIEPEHRDAILEGLRSAASASGGTSADVFKGFPIPVAGKTGTAEKGLGRPDQSWYIALAPYPNPRYVVAVTDEAGGFGAETAAPAARRILASLFDVRGQEKKIVKGDSRTF
ncbi:MAG TPA: penicillin-binding protein 2 [Thermoleophilaceae bacterium]|nr:penicillin-binding protein 2 [Thermoleophilaceae bacterium]